MFVNKISSKTVGPAEVDVCRPQLPRARSGGDGVLLQVLLDGSLQIGRHASVGGVADHLGVPAAAVQGDTRHDQRCVVAAGLAEVEGAQVLCVLAANGRHDVAVGVGHLPEGLTAEGVDGEVQRLDCGVDLWCCSVGLQQAQQVDQDGLVVALAGTGEVVAGVAYRSAAAEQLSVRDREEHLAMRVDCGAVGVEVDAADALGRVPAEAHADPLQAAAVGLEQADDVPLGQADRGGCGLLGGFRLLVSVPEWHACFQSTAHWPYLGKRL